MWKSKRNVALKKFFNFPPFRKFGIKGNKNHHSIKVFSGKWNSWEEENCYAIWKDRGEKDVNKEQLLLRNIWLEIILALCRHTYVNKVCRHKVPTCLRKARRRQNDVSIKTWISIYVKIAEWRREIPGLLISWQSIYISICNHYKRVYEKFNKYEWRKMIWRNLLRDRLQIPLLILSEFKWVN